MACRSWSSHWSLSFRPWDTRQRRCTLCKLHRSSLLKAATIFSKKCCFDFLKENESTCFETHTSVAYQMLPWKLKCTQYARIDAEPATSFLCPEKQHPAAQSPEMQTKPRYQGSLHHHDELGQNLGGIRTNVVHHVYMVLRARSLK